MTEKSKHKCLSLESFSIQFVVVVKIPRTQWPYYFTDLYWLHWRSVHDFGKEKWKVCLFQTDSMFILFTYNILKNYIVHPQMLPFSPHWGPFCNLDLSISKSCSWHPQPRAFWLNKFSSQRSGLYTHLGYFQFSWD